MSPEAEIPAEREREKGRSTTLQTRVTKLVKYITGVLMCKDGGGRGSVHYRKSADSLKL